MQRFFPRSNGSEPHIRLPSPGVLHQEEKVSECLALKASRLAFGRARGLWETETPLLNSTHKISHTPAPRAEAVM